jgi:hypothetical protein
MAQETRVNPIQFDNTASQIMMNMAASFNRRDTGGDDKEKERLRVEQEEQRRLAQQNKELLNSLFDPSKLQATTRSSKVKDIVANTNAVLRGGLKGGTTAEVAEQALQALLDLQSGDAKYSGIVKSIEDREKSLTDDEKRGLNIGEAKQVALRNALKKQDAKGNWVPKPFEELDDQQDYLGSLINSPDGLKFANLSVGFDDLTKEVTEAPKSTETKSIKVQRGRTINSESMKVTWSPKFQYYDDKAEEIKLRTDSSGLIEDDVYKELTAKPSINRTLTSRAMTFINDYNTADAAGKALMATKAGLPTGSTMPPLLDPADPKTIEGVKKSFLTKTISNQIGRVEADQKQNIVLPAPVINNYNNWTNTDPTNTAPNDRITGILNLDTRFLGAASKSGKGDIIYDVTDQFNNLPLFKTRSGVPYGPKEVQYNTVTKQFFVRERDGQGLKTYDAQSWRDVIVPATSGTGYNPKPKGTPR